ncbi:hypothetical protein EDC23_1422 [Thiohalophilus thiocyanatoxydans]|uniref:Uncharacterized protein n=1 Tax=Thiohalophilus thiocyanatoxydans TaxID=381308 RepID=A0A4R8IVY9_9GAMM|nr:hypothetical protein EDC23_1422 [Thiohalophilus thiocyanatoxydans]
MCPWPGRLRSLPCGLIVGAAMKRGFGGSICDANHSFDSDQCDGFCKLSEKPFLNHRVTQGSAAQPAIDVPRHLIEQTLAGGPARPGNVWRDNEILQPGL